MSTFLTWCDQAVIKSTGRRDSQRLKRKSDGICRICSGKQNEVVLDSPRQMGLLEIRPDEERGLGARAFREQERQRDTVGP